MNEANLKGLPVSDQPHRDLELEKIHNKRELEKIIARFPHGSPKLTDLRKLPPIPIDFFEEDVL